MEYITLHKKNEAHIKVECDSGVAQELSEFFKFRVPGYKFMQAYKNRMWDGYIRLFNTNTHEIYAGLADYIDKFAKDREYLLEYSYDFGDEEFSLKEARDFVLQNKDMIKMAPRDYQMDAFAHAIRKSRSLLLSPTASGKSFIIYLIMLYYNLPTLIVVPTTTLVHQMAADFVEYGYDEKDIHKIYSGQDKDTDAKVVITTWQSIYKLKPSWFKKYDVVFGDEAHLFKAKSLIDILTKMVDTKYRFGFTGTLDGSHTHKLVLEGLFGTVNRVTTTKELIDNKQLSAFDIKCIILQYPDEIRKAMKKSTYQDEIDYIVRNEKRNKFIKNLTLSLNGNTLLLFQFVEKHGKILYESMEKERKNVYFIHGGIDGNIRNEIRQIVEGQTDAIIIASYGVFSTGINIKNLHNIIFASPSKSRIRNLQSIGRGLRRSETKESATLFDIADDLVWKSKKNHTILHLVERIKIYNEEKFNYKIYNVKLR